MDGVAIIRELLAADTGFTDLVPAERISAGVLTTGIELDAISIARISGTDRNIIQPGATRHVMERVQVTAAAATYPRMKAILHAARAAAADYIGEAAGLSDVTVRTDSTGPDFMDEESSIHMGSQDFIVAYNELR